MSLSLSEMDVYSRDIFYSIESTSEHILFSLLSLAAVSIFLRHILHRISFWFSGKEAFRLIPSFSKLAAKLLKTGLSPSSTLRTRPAWMFHQFISLGFTALFVATLIVMIAYHFNPRVFQAHNYLAVSLLADLGGCLLLLGIALALFRRTFNPVNSFTSTREDYYILFFIAGLAIQGFFLEALRIAAAGDPAPLFSPIGTLLSWSFWSLSANSLRSMHHLLWWLHSLSALVFLAVLPNTKLLHLAAAGLNLLLRTSKLPRGVPSWPGTLGQAFSPDEQQSPLPIRLGISHVSDITAIERLQLDSCTACGYCQDECPASRCAEELSPKDLVIQLRNFARAPRSNSPIDGPACFTEQNSPLPLWQCTTCQACTAACPNAVDPASLIVELRRSEVLLRGKLPHEAARALRFIELRGNPYGRTESRNLWTDGLEVPLLKPGDSVEVLLWVGCAAAFDKRRQSIARAMAQILNASGLKWGILGDFEKCSGELARRLGDERLFQLMAQKNLSVLNSLSFNTLLCLCPHCFHTFTHDYPHLGNLGGQRKIRVMHYVSFVSELLKKGSLPLSKQTLPLLTYHDSCYLGRANGILSPPRSILKAIGASEIKEMDNSLLNSKCCGAGGGRYWFDLHYNPRPNQLRMSQAAQTGAQLVVTSCPFCLNMLEDARTPSTALKVIDLAELVAGSLKG